MSIIATAVKHMLAAGMEPDAIVAAVAEMESERPLQEGRSKAAIRQANYRERKAAQTVTNHNKTSQSITSVTTTPSLSPPNENNLTPPIPTPVYNTPRARRLPADWVPAPLPRQLLDQVSAWRAGLLESELAKFRDWAASAPDKAGLKKDWDAAWRNWLRRKDEEAPKNGNFARNQQNDGMGRTERAAIQALRDLGAIPDAPRGCAAQSNALPPPGSHAAIGQEPYPLLTIGDERSGPH